MCLCAGSNRYGRGWDRTKRPRLPLLLTLVDFGRGSRGFGTDVRGGAEVMNLLSTTFRMVEKWSDP